MAARTTALVHRPGQYVSAVTSDVGDGVAAMGRGEDSGGGGTGSNSRTPEGGPSASEFAVTTRGATLALASSRCHPITDLVKTFCPTLWVMRLAISFERLGGVEGP